VAFLALQQDLDGTKWLRGSHWVFPSLSESVKFSYSAVMRWPYLSRQHLVITVHVIRDDPPGYNDVRFQLGNRGTEPYCVEYLEGQSQPEGVADGSTVTPEPGPATIDRWKLAISGISSEVNLLENNSLTHPAYMRRPLEETPPSVRIGMRMACAQIDPATATSTLRARFREFLGRPPVMELLRELTEVGDAVWTPRNENPPFNFGAILAPPGSEEIPLAWARLLLPDSQTQQYGRDARFAYLVLYLEPQQGGQPAPPAGLPIWHQHLGNALQLPAALAAFLTDVLELATTDDPAAEVAVWLKAQRSLTDLVEVDAFEAVAGSPQANWFTAYAIANPEGDHPSETALAWLRRLCDQSLHLIDYESELDSLRSTAADSSTAGRASSEGVLGLSAACGGSEEGGQRRTLGSHDPSRQQAPRAR